MQKKYSTKSMTRDLLTQALINPVSIQFDTREDAEKYRRELYRIRDGLRLVGVLDYDGLKFKITRNILTISDTKLVIRNML